MKENIFKVAFSVAAAGMVTYFQAMIIPVAILLFVMIADYSTGMIKAWILKEINSRIGIIGIIKKLCYLIIVCAGVGVDWIIRAALSQIGISYTSAFTFGLIVIIWLIINELISILENLSKIGIPLPEFLTKTVKKLKITVEKKAETENSSIESEENNYDRR
jgi:toxin secretion/phage lysis holin